MQINLVNEEIIQALVLYLNRVGIYCREDDTTFNFTASRKGEGVSCTIEVGTPPVVYSEDNKPTAVHIQTAPKVGTEDLEHQLEMPKSIKEGKRAPGQKKNPKPFQKKVSIPEPEEDILEEEEELILTRHPVQEDPELDSEEVIEDDIPDFIEEAEEESEPVSEATQAALDTLTDDGEERIPDPLGPLIEEATEVKKRSLFSKKEEPEEEELQEAKPVRTSLFAKARSGATDNKPMPANAASLFSKK